MKSVDVTAGTLEYRETGDPAGPPVVLLHGLLMNDTQWQFALPLLPTGFRYLLPVLPIGSHRIPMHPEADLTMPGMVGLVAEFLDALELSDVCLVVTDWGGPLFLTDLGLDTRISRLVICPCEAFGNFPPGFPGMMTWVASRTTGTLALAMKQMRIKWLRDRFFMFGMMAARSIPQTVMDAWTEPGLTDRRIRADLLKYCRSTFDKRDLERATNRLADFDGDVLVLWSHNAVMPAEHAQRLAALTGGRLRYVDNAKVLIMLDQPEQTAAAISTFLTTPAPTTPKPTHGPEKTRTIRRNVGLGEGTQSSSS